MNNSLILQLTFLVAASFALYLISRISVRSISHVFYRNFGSEKLTFWVMSLIFLPGTIVHEISHFLMATVLFLRVADVGIFPKKQGDRIVLGHVLYEKKDFIRSILVGIAPFLGASGLFLMLFYFHLFPTENILWNVVYGYVVFAVSTTMFSSKQDLQDAVYIIPLLVIIAAVFYIFDIRIIALMRVHTGVQILQTINQYLLIAIVINIIILAILKGVQLLVSR